MKKSARQGFTLIELLVVIAIIGILSAIVLSSLSNAKLKANDAKIQGQLHSFRNAASLYVTLHGNFGIDSTNGNNICTVTSTDDTGLYALEQAGAYPNGVAPTCTTDADVGIPATQWSAYLELSDGSFYCVDNVESEKIEPSTWTAPTGGAACP